MTEIKEKEELIQNIDAGKEQLKKEISKINQIIKQRKQEALEKDYYNKLYKIVHKLGEHSDWGGGEYNYHSPDLYIKYASYYNSITVTIGYPAEEVFDAKKRGYDTEISLYIKGDWEKCIEPLLDKAKINSHKSELDHLITIIEDKKKKWKL